VRLWSLSPKYLDPKGLVALWREALLAKNVLEDKTKGYRNHPQLTRFKNLKEPIKAINKYLEYIFLESVSRKYNFDPEKYIEFNYSVKIPVTTGQLNFEKSHLVKKLKIRYPKGMDKLNDDEIEPNPLFKQIEGDIEEWEII
jgi:hypothetical protein